MKQHELIELRNAIEDMDIGSLLDNLEQKHEQFKAIDMLGGKANNLNPFLSAMQGELHKLDDVAHRVNDLVFSYQFQLDVMIDDGARQRIDIENMQADVLWRRFKTADFIRTWYLLPLSDATRQLVIARIKQYTDWRYPALEIRPGDGEWTQYLTSCLPLYLVDYDNEFLDIARGQFNEELQKRVRCYKNAGEGLYMLPQNQFGIIFSWNTFNYLSLNQIEDYLKEIYATLRPGGACMFSYNNAERPGGALRSDTNYATHIPKKVLLELISKFGFVNTQTYDEDLFVSWVEFKKPGNLTFKRGSSPSLGKIIKRPPINQ